MPAFSSFPVIPTAAELGGNWLKGFKDFNRTARARTWLFTEFLALTVLNMYLMLRHIRSTTVSHGEIQIFDIWRIAPLSGLQRDFQKNKEVRSLQPLR